MLVKQKTVTKVNALTLPPRLYRGFQPKITDTRYSLGECIVISLCSYLNINAKKYDLENKSLCTYLKRFWFVLVIVIVLRLEYLKRFWTVLVIVLRTVFVKILKCLSLSLSAEFWTNFLWLACLSQLSQ